MAFHYLSNVPLEQAKRDFLAELDAAGLAPREEMVPVSEALGRRTARPVYAALSAPHYHACAMDGIALMASVTFGATATTPVEVPPERYIVVDTGDPLPEGCDAVVMIEDVLIDEEGQLGSAPVKLLASVAPWAHVRQIGEDICAGEMLLTSNVSIEPAALGALLAAGVGEVAVWAKPVVGIIPTGDEIVEPTPSPKPGDIIEFNSTIFGGMVSQWGGVARAYPIVKDDLASIERMLAKALGECDVVLLNAGSSAGRDDYAAQAIASVAEVLFHGLSIKPGKPAILAHAGAKPVIGVPGYPVSGIVVIEELLKPVIERLTGSAFPVREVSATLSRQVVSSLKYQEFVRVRLGNVEGQLVASPLPRGAGVVTSFVKADGMLAIPQNSEGLAAGETVRVRLLRPLEEVQSALVVTGSHDPLIDELAEIIHACNPSITLASTHVGSMGALSAAKRREMHCGGIHLLDEETGIYNEAYLERHFPRGGIRQVECVYRKQGLMVAPGNPRGIQSMADLAREGMRYVNRQKGSGTRILADFVCARNGIDSSKIYGYDHEEMTHTAVAALVEAGSADAGMGIFSAACMYGLDFIDVCEEQYDLLIPDYAWDTPAVQALMQALQSDAFRTRLEAMGGYRVESPGRVRRHYEATAQPE